MILGFANVPVDQVDRIEEKFNEVIHGILYHPNHEDLMSRMGVISKWNLYIDNLGLTNLVIINIKCIFATNAFSRPHHLVNHNNALLESQFLENLGL